MKFDRVAEVAKKLPRARAAILEHLALEGMPVERAVATAVRLLDLGYFRIGSDAYADANGSFGLTTLEKRHVRRRKDVLVFKFEGKSGIEHEIEIDDPLAVAAVDTMRRRRGRRGPAAGLQADAVLDADGRRDWSTTTSARPPAPRSPPRTSAPGTPPCSRPPRWPPARSPATPRPPASARCPAAMKEVASYLGNTPTIARSSYVDPRVIDLYEDGVTIETAVRRSYDSPDERQRAMERAVSRMLASAPKQSGRRARSGR